VVSESYPTTTSSTLTIRELTTPAEFLSVDRLQRRVWGIETGATPVPAEVLNAVSHSGGYVVGAFADGRLVGSVSSLIGRHAKSRQIFLWAQMFAAETRDSGVGHALLMDQRSWCLKRDIHELRWTFDPLVSRNAYFGLTKLGAEVLAYVPDFYGPLDDGVNLNDESDRLLVTWGLDEHDTRNRTDFAVAAAYNPREWAPLLSIDEHGGPKPHPLDDEPRMSCAVPADIEAIRRSDPAVARSWRFALRECLSRVLDRGGRIAGFTRSGHYLLTAGDTRT
jgi:predicted GNAT superfamily acetyltransferase